jgi:hypothetical protein
VADQPNATAEELAKETTKRYFGAALAQIFESIDSVMALHERGYRMLEQQAEAAQAEGARNVGIDSLQAHLLHWAGRQMLHRGQADGFKEARAMLKDLASDFEKQFASG